MTVPVVVTMAVVTAAIVMIVVTAAVVVPVVVLTRLNPTIAFALCLYGADLRDFTLTLQLARAFDVLGSDLTFALEVAGTLDLALTGDRNLAFTSHRDLALTRHGDLALPSNVAIAIDLSLPLGSGPCDVVQPTVVLIVV
ncbi:MAG TPA: hypothetical protein VGM50_13590, partial [Gemmatimonadaceae bacterium]